MSTWLDVGLLHQNISNSFWITAGNNRSALLLALVAKSWILGHTVAPQIQGQRLEVMMQLAVDVCILLTKCGPRMSAESSWSLTLNLPPKARIGLLTAATYGQKRTAYRERHRPVD